MNTKTNLVKIDFKTKQKFVQDEQDQSKAPNSSDLKSNTAPLNNQPNMYINGAIAKVVGKSPAILVNWIVWSINYHKKHNESRFYIDDRWWMYNTNEELADKFNTNRRTVTRWIKKVKDSKIVIVRQYNKSKWDHVNYYSIDEDIYQKIISAIPVKKPKTKPKSQDSNIKYEIGKNVPIDRDKMSQSIETKCPNLPLSINQTYISNTNAGAREDLTLSKGKNSVLTLVETKDIPPEVKNTPPLNDNIELDPIQRVEKKIECWPISDLLRDDFLSSERWELYGIAATSYEEKFKVSDWWDDGNERKQFEFIVTHMGWSKRIAIFITKFISSREEAAHTLSKINGKDIENSLLAVEAIKETLNMKFSEIQQMLNWADKNNDEFYKEKLRRNDFLTYHYPKDNRHFLTHLYEDFKKKGRGHIEGSIKY